VSRPSGLLTPFSAAFTLRLHAINSKAEKNTFLISKIINTLFSCKDTIFFSKSIAKSVQKTRKKQKKSSHCSFDVMRLTEEHKGFTENTENIEKTEQLQTLCAAV
jgi:hypothetical protein